MDERDFTCAICKRVICMRWNMPGRRNQLPPVCLGCEHQYTEGVSEPHDGSFRDRRNAIRILALAEALHGKARAIEWSCRHAQA